MTIFALEQCVENGVDLNINDAESALAELNILRAQLAEAQKDAEQWRWLKDHARIFRQSPDMSENHYWMVQATQCTVLTSDLPSTQRKEIEHDHTSSSRVLSRAAPARTTRPQSGRA